MSRFAILSALLSASSLATSAEPDVATSLVGATAGPENEIPASLTCAEEQIVVGGCDPNDVVSCATNCNLFKDNSKEPGYLLDKCCKHVGVNANLLAFEKAELWVPRIEEFSKCTGASIRLQYNRGEDYMATDIIDDVGVDDGGGAGIFDAYIVQAPWLPPVYKGLKSLSEFISMDDKYINFYDINQASRAAVSFDGSVRALPLDADYIALGWRQDVFEKYASQYEEMYGEPLKVPDTIEELVDVSEKLNGKFDYNNDGIADWGFCLTPQTNYFQAFLAPILQTHLHACDIVDGKKVCDGLHTGQNIFFDVDTFEPLIHNEGYRHAVELYWRFIRASNCQVQTAAGEKCDRKTAFKTGRCAGVLSMPGTMTNLLKEGGKYAPPPEVRMDAEVLSEGGYWGRRKIFPGSRMVIDWNKPGQPLVECNDEICPLSRNSINYAPFFAEGGESYALNGQQSKPAATAAMWDLFTWFATLPVGEVPLAGTYRKSQLEPEAIDALAEKWDNRVMADDLNAVLQEYFKDKDEGGNPVQDLFIIGFPDYNEALDTELHKKLLLADVSDGGLFNKSDPSKSLDPVKDKEVFDMLYNGFIKNLEKKFSTIHNKYGGALSQLSLWRGALGVTPVKSKDDICADLLASDVASFDRLDCINQVSLEALCQVLESDVEDYKPGTCSDNNNKAIIAIIALCSVVGAGLLVGTSWYAYRRYLTYQHIRKAHEQLMEATLNEAIRALHQLDYPLHLIRGDEFSEEGKLMRHEVLRNTHKLTVLDSLSDVDAFVAAGKHVVFFSHQWTSFTLPDPSCIQYDTMVLALKDLVKRNGWDESLKDVFVWVDFSSIPQANPSTQNLAIRSLAAYASSATYFIIVAPDTPHADLDDNCDFDTYQKRMWCRAEQCCHLLRNGMEGMYLKTGANNPLTPVKNDHFVDSLHVFDGELTCCRLEHKGLASCDRQSLVIPLLGLYGELIRAAADGRKGGNADSLQAVEAFLSEIDSRQEEVFPRTFKRVMWRKNKRVIEEVVLFGDLIERMRAKAESGTLEYNEDMGAATASTNSSDFIRHGASDFLRHGVVHGGMSNSQKNGVHIETAVGSL